ncbi:hypothetical protein [Propionicimonas sp.]|uniref:3-dehydroquinate synthase family protein n=1 Tax=Propionicimonas sp. TaxID=1955623 RepID=UPI001DFA1ABC|nr:hypothetical protein [Propionicimonas sp.]MBU3975693.1 3-dehydroquinate synthase [Actinomycetota bacterium]MBU3986158.1 3-dehydroquinate synthase [Actinomycetota bacterium]MBU4007727.1 3-dehydroquinate synthase [Actinomycetota bacterium]MBU4063985.1 3-dehydroquinate synthase [Actinomycetota bacterium]MBU4093077.1 3-dehydroquinate synthase [Actinomycetota bacterium]
MAERSEFDVATSTGDYRVSLGSGQLAQAVGNADVILVDASLAHLLPSSAERVITIDSTEESKTLTGCEQVILELRSAGVRRGHRLLAVGGGIVQDVATFVADVYMRGLAWSYAPTTLMAMADSCIGGKSSINVGEVKNLVGGIYPPQQVYIDPVFLDTLSPAALGSGFSEAAKIAFCRGPGTFNEYLRRYAAFDTDPIALISHVLSAKKWFVEIDEHDKLERRLLNFGHTFGHALESAVNHALPHGLGVSVGVLCASAHPDASNSEPVQALRDHCLHLLEMAPDVVEDALAQFDRQRYERAFRSDKKHSDGFFHLILPQGDSVAEVRISANTGWDSILAATNSTIDVVRSHVR